MTQTRQHFVAKGYLSSVEPAPDIWARHSTKADKVTVRWPTGATTVLSDVEAGRTIVVEEEKEPRG